MIEVVIRDLEQIAVWILWQLSDCKGVNLNLSTAVTQFNYAKLGYCRGKDLLFIYSLRNLASKSLPIQYGLITVCVFVAGYVCWVSRIFKVNDN